MCTVAAFLTTCAGLEMGYVPSICHLPRRETHLGKQNVLQLKDGKTRACQVVVQVWPVEFAVQDGQREPMLEVITWEGRVAFIFSFPQSVIERIHA